MKKIIIYQMMTRLFGNKKNINKEYGTIEENGVGKFSEINENALKGIKELGVTHVWYTGVIEHATMVNFEKYGIKADNPMLVKGVAGSPYAIKDYYDVNPYLADNIENRIEEFKELIKRTHEAGLKVVIDFVPNHLSREYSSDKRPEGILEFGECDNDDVSFDPQNNFYYITGKKFVAPFYKQLREPASEYFEYPAKATGNDVFKEDPDIDAWFETIKLNYGVDYLNNKKKYFKPLPLTWKMMRDVLIYWAEMGVDGFRCDMVEMVPHEFWAWVIDELKQKRDLIFIGESYNPDEYETYINKGKFDYLYDKQGMYEAVRGVMEGKSGTAGITDVICRQKIYEKHMLKFLENHDEQRIASEYFAGNPMKGIPGMALMSMISTAPVMIYFGQEVGEKGAGPTGFENIKGRTTIFDFWGVTAHQRWMGNGEFDGSYLLKKEKELRGKYTEILNFAMNSDAVCDGVFTEVETNDERIYSFIRMAQTETIIVCVNFADCGNSMVILKSKLFENNCGKKAKGIFGTPEKRVFEENQLEITMKPYGVKVFRME